MKERKTIPQKVIDDLLVKSKRRCPVCVEAGDTKPKIGNVAHLIPIHEGGTNSIDNLVFLCPQHHAELDRGTPRAPSVSEVRAARDALYRAIEHEASAPIPDKPRVFVIHGRDEEAKMTLVKFLKNLGLEAIVLSKQPSFGKTVLEKLEDNIDINYAIAILTLDESSTRARQNVIFELGFFMGRLGRHNVCALVKGNVEIPSEFHGVLYIDMDSGGSWQDILQRELVDAGLAIRKKVGDGGRGRS